VLTAFRTISLSIAVSIAASARPKSALEMYPLPMALLQPGYLRDAVLPLSAIQYARARQSTNSAPRISGTSPTDQQTPSASPQPPFLHRPILFDRNSLELDSIGSKALLRTAAWLKAHTDSRVLIVGSCDTSGSESCTHTLAEGRGVVVRKSLESFGVSPDQIVGVKGWETADRDCRPSSTKCQQLSRSAQLLLAPSVARQKE